MNLKVKQFYSKDYGKFLILLPVVLFQILYLTHGIIYLANDWQSIELTFSYSEYGFIRRGLIGELAQRLAKVLNFDYAYSFITYFELIFMLVFLVAALSFLWFIIKSTGREEKNIVFSVMLFFVVLGGISFYFYDWAEPDIYMLMLTFVSVICIIKDRLLFLIPLNCVLCTMIHEGYPMMFFVIIMAMLFYKWLSKEKITIDKYFYTILFSGIFTSALFVYFYFFSKVNENITLDYMCKRVADSTFLDQRENIEYLFFNGPAPKYGFWMNGKPTWHFFRNVINVALNIMLYSPILYGLYRVQKSTVLKCVDIKEKIKYLVFFLGFAVIIPLFICHTDTGRWLMDFWFYEFLLFAFLIIIKDNKFIDSIKNDKYFKNLLMLVPVYFIMGLAMDKETINKLTNEISSKLTDYIIFVLSSILH